MDQSGSILKNYIQDLKAFQSSDSSKEVFSLIDQIGDAFREELKSASESHVEKRHAKQKVQPNSPKESKEAIEKPEAKEEQPEAIRAEAPKEMPAKEEAVSEKTKVNEKTEKLPKEKTSAEAKEKIIDEMPSLPEQATSEEEKALEKIGDQIEAQVEEKQLLEEGENSGSEIASDLLPSEEVEEKIPVEQVEVKKQEELKKQEEIGIIEQPKAINAQQEATEDVAIEEEIPIEAKKIEIEKNPKEIKHAESPKIEKKEDLKLSEQAPIKAEPKSFESSEELLEKTLEKLPLPKVGEKLAENVSAKEEIPVKEEGKTLAAKVLESMDKEDLSKVLKAIQNITQTATIQKPVIEALPPQFMKALEEFGSELAKELRPEGRGELNPIQARQARLTEGAERRTVKFSENMKTYHDPKMENLKNQVVQQVKIKLKAAIEGSKGQVTMHLKPKLLGEVKIKLVIEEASVKATFIVENHTAKEMLLKGAGDLQDALEEKGIHAEEIAVEVRDESSSDFNHQGKAFAAREDQEAGRQILQALHTFGVLNGDSEPVEAVSRDEEDSDSLINIIA